MTIEQAMIKRIEDKDNTRDVIAEHYALLYRNPDMEKIDCVSINKAIIKRWSISALKYIKDKAWKSAHDDSPKT